MADDENIWITGDLDFVESEVLTGKSKRRGFSETLLPSEIQTNSNSAPFLTGNDMLQGILQKIKASIKQQDVEVAKAGSFVPATEPSFIARLDKAMQKNFNYLIRKDTDPNFGKPNNDKKDYYAPSGSFQPTQSTSKKLHNSAAGIGMIQQVAVQIQESCSVYINNLPSDITQEELEILFGGTQGKIIKKIKIYTLPDGKKKGDALITFSKSEHAHTACIKFHNLNIGEGHVITVERANFANKPTSSTAEDGSNEELDKDKEEQDDAESAVQTQPVAASSLSLSTLEVQGVLYSILPAESEGGKYPLTLIRNAFHSTPPADTDISAYFDDLEADMLIECCKFGKVRFIQLLCLPDLIATRPDINLLQQPQPQHRILLEALDGAVVVTFEARAAAESCAAALAERWFDGRQLKTSIHLPASMTAVIPPPPRPPPFPRPPSLSAASTISNTTTTTTTTAVAAVITTAITAMATNSMTDSSSLVEDMAAAAEDVDSFLNSLL